MGGGGVSGHQTFEIRDNLEQAVNKWSILTIDPAAQGD